MQFLPVDIQSFEIEHDIGKFEFPRSGVHMDFPLFYNEDIACGNGIILFFGSVYGIAVENDYEFLKIMIMKLFPPL